MDFMTDMLRPTEAAVVARVALRDVNRVIDERILPEAFFSVDDGRRVLAAACTLIAFYFDSARSLTSEERLFAIREAGSRLHRLRGRTPDTLSDEDWTVRDGFLTIDMTPFVRRTTEGMERLDAARQMVVSDPEILSGTPVIRGTRVPVHQVAGAIAAGDSRERILEDYPTIREDQIDLAVIYAEANPPRGRPRSVIDALPEGTVAIADYRVPYHRKAG
jgi:uncharacterized protein (DUF433 family)